MIMVLRSGSLKLRPILEHEEKVGATLGQDYVERGFFSGVLALVLVLAFMIIYYRGLGLYAAIRGGMKRTATLVETGG
jgi:preprotein translocase subunit SecD